MYKVDCIILAAGRSTRMNTYLSKQFLEINGKPIIYYSIDKFIRNTYVSKIILVLSNDYVSYCNENIIDRFFLGERISIVVGGNRRQDSVLNALKFIESEYVIVHDGARPFVSNSCIIQGIEYAYRYGASSCYVVPKDTVKLNNGGEIVALDRDMLMSIQTPQCFKTSTLIDSYEYVFKNGLDITDETSALDLMGEKTFFYLGEYSNIKITTEEDLYFGSVILNNILGELK